jgi:hypothetical protein
MSDEPLRIEMADREAVIYTDGRGEAHILDDRNWSAARLDFVQRATLAAKLRAIAELVDPGPLGVYETRQAAWLGAESVSHP